MTLAVDSVADDWDHSSASRWISHQSVVDRPPDAVRRGLPAFRAPNLSDLTRLDTERSPLSLAIQSLTDEAYRIHGSGVNEPGRNVVASLAGA